MPGNPAFLAQLSARVRDAEMDLIFIINFDFNIEVPSTMAIYELRELGLTEAVAATDERVRAVRELAVKTASLRLVACRPGCFICFHWAGLLLAHLYKNCLLGVKEVDTGCRFAGS